MQKVLKAKVSLILSIVLVLVSIWEAIVAKSSLL